jgi:RNA polymerase sigma factor (sigma-70 family)
MNEDRADFELLRDFARNGDQPAFSTLVRRHLNLVFGSAARKAGDHGGAEEISQNVFGALARKAWRFAPDDSLPAWLHQTTLLEAKFWLRGELRRRRREQTAAELGTTMNASDEQSALRALIPLVDEALLSLREKDRAALLLRYYESRSLREVAGALGVREDAAQKRVAGAVEKVARFFQRRGIKTATGAIAIAVLEQTSGGAPAAAAAGILRAAAQLAPPALAGLPALLSRFAGLTKAQTVAVCVAVSAAPAAWQWNEARGLHQATAALQSQQNSATTRQAQASADLDRMRAESARLEDALTEAGRAQARNQQALQKLAVMGARLRGLLADPNYRWSDELPFVRIPKSTIRKVAPQWKFNFTGGGSMTASAIEVLGLTPEEKAAAESALGNYCKGVQDLMTANAYETNLPASQSAAFSKTIVVPPLGNDLKTLAANTGVEITQLLGADRENLLFGGWDRGNIQIFWPGNPENIAETGQQFTVSVKPDASGSGEPVFQTRWSFAGSSTSTDHYPGEVPVFMADRFFAPWVRQLGAVNSTTTLQP